MIGVVLTGTSFAQEHREERRDVIFTQAVPAMPGEAGVTGAAGGGTANVMMFNTAGGAGGMVQFMSTEMAFEGSVVKGAPYSAEAVTETTQVLGDGNKISRKTSTSLYRDGEGRTRREQSMPAIGPWATSGAPPVTIFINDPASGAHYVLDSNSKTAHKSVASKFTAIPDRVPKAATFSRGIATGITSVAATPPDVKEEKLQPQSIEGVQAEGTRSTITIPAGQMGNERPILIVSERWFSPELKMVVKTVSRDPRMGETTYTLTNLQRSEPSRSLFDIPSDYTVVEDGSEIVMREHKLMMERQMKKDQ